MKAALLESSGQVSVGTAPDPEPGDRVLVRVRAAGVCGTELHFLDGMLTPNAYPFILGHEIAGTVEHAPAKSGFAGGERVVVYNFAGCGQCAYCRGGRDELCDAPVGQFGFNLDGGFAEYVSVPPSNLIRLPDSVSFETASALACSGMSAVHAVRLAGVSLGQMAVVNGVGGVGLMVLQVARLAGAGTIAVGDSEEKLRLARAAGASQTLLVAGADAYDALPARVRELTDGRGTDHFFELVGTEATMRAGVRSLAKMGTFISIGYTGDNLVISPVELILGELRILASVAAAKRDLETAVRLAAGGQLTATIDTRYALEDIGVALDRLRSRQVLGRNVIVFEGG